MSATLGQLAKLVSGKLKGESSLAIKGFCSLEHPRPEHISFVETNKDLDRAGKPPPAAVITNSRLARHFPEAIVVDNPRLAFALVMEHFLGQERPSVEGGISKAAFVDKKARLGEDVVVGPFTTVEKDARIGNGSVIGAGCHIGNGATIGEHTLLYPRVTVLERCEIGSYCIINSGTVVGSEGFGFVTTEEGHRKFPQTGRVVIEDNVEIGANCTIDRAAIDETRIGQGCKIDNLVQIAHNVQIGEHTMIVAQSGIAGSTKIGPWCVLGGQSGLVGGIDIGAGSQVAGQSGVFSSLPPGSRVSGYPARPHQQAMRVLALTFKLPEITEKIKALEAEVKKLRREKKKQD